MGTSLCPEGPHTEPPGMRVQVGRWVPPGWAGMLVLVLGCAVLASRGGSVARAALCSQFQPSETCCPANGNAAELCEEDSKSINRGGRERLIGMQMQTLTSAMLSPQGCGGRPYGPPRGHGVPG